MNKNKYFSVDELMRTEDGGRKSVKRREESELDPELLEEVMALVIEPYIEQTMQSFIPTSLVSSEAEHERRVKEASDKVKTYLQTLHRGIQRLTKEGSWSEDIFSLQESGMFQERLEAGDCPQKVLHISDDWMHTVYKEVCQAYEKKEMDKAIDLLELLLFLNPKPIAYWQLLGRIEYVQGHKEEAKDPLLRGVQGETTSLVPYVYAINCLIDLEQKQQAIELIQSALKLESAKEQNAGFLQEELHKLQQALGGCKP